MDLLRQLRDSAARLATRLGPEPWRHTRWARRARLALYIAATALLVWEATIIVEGESTTGATAARFGAVLSLYLLGHWPAIAAGLSLPMVILELVLGFHEMSLTILVPITITAVLVATRPRPAGYLYAAAIVLALTTINRSELPLADLLTWLAIFALPCVLGELVRYVVAAVKGIQRATAQQLRHQRQELARELHDTSIHDITSMIMALERAKLAGISDPKALEEVEFAIAAGRQSVVSMRGVLKILRSGALSTDPARGVPEAIAAATPTVRRALDEARAVLARAGMTLQDYFEDELDMPMPQSVRTALVRVVQECTVNMAKYGAPGSTGTVMIQRTETETSALFVNEAARRARDDAATSSRLGLVGVRERVEAVGGTVSVRHHEDRWMIQVSIPTIGTSSEGQVERARQH